MSGDRTAPARNLAGAPCWPAIRGRTAAALPVHRNTLRDRIHRISELTGVDLDSVEGRGMAWLAWLQRRHSTSCPASGDGLGQPHV
jgi:aryl carrier-like protein